MDNSATSTSGGNPLVAKLETFAGLGDEDRAALLAALSDVRDVAADSDIIREGDKPEHIHLVIEGWAARYKLLPDGSRQITAFLIPGDFCDLHITILPEMDHSIVALTPARVAFVPARVMEALPLDRPRLARALWWATLVDEAVLRAWIVNLGRREAMERIAHLLCELHLRLRHVGLAEEGRFDLPVTQEELADALGLTAIHTNRVIQRLRADGLITLRERRLTILDVDGLRKLSGFDPRYLHAQGRSAAEPKT